MSAALALLTAALVHRNQATLRPHVAMALPMLFLLIAGIQIIPILGYVLAVGSVQTSQKSSTVVAILVPLVALGVPIADTTAPTFTTKLLDLGLSQKQAVLILYAVSIVLGGAALLLTVATSLQSALLLGAMGLLAFFGISKLGYGRLGHGAASPEDVDLRRQLDRLASASDEDCGAS